MIKINEIVDLAIYVRNSKKVAPFACAFARIFTFKVQVTL